MKSNIYMMFEGYTFSTSVCVLHVCSLSPRVCVWVNSSV